MSIAFWVSPDGEIIEVKKGKHIAEIIAYPVKFGFTREFVEFVFNNYNEKIGQEGKARKQLMLVLFDNNWIRIRRYKKFWSINVKKNIGTSNSYLNQWAKKILIGLHGFKENDPYISVRIDQKDQKLKIVELKSIAEAGTFMPEHMLIEKTIAELPDLKPYNFINEIMIHGIKQGLFNDYSIDEINKKNIAEQQLIEKSEKKLQELKEIISKGSYKRSKLWRGADVIITPEKVTNLSWTHTKDIQVITGAKTLQVHYLGCL